MGGCWGIQGIGSGFANELAHRETNSVLVACTRSTLDEAADEVRSANHGVDVRTLAVDLSVPDGAEQEIAAPEGLEIGTLATATHDVWDRVTAIDVGSVGFGSTGAPMVERMVAAGHMVRVHV